MRKYLGDASHLHYADDCDVDSVRSVIADVILQMEQLNVVGMHFRILSVFDFGVLKIHVDRGELK